MLWIKKHCDLTMIKMEMVICYEKSFLGNRVVRSPHG